MKMLLLLGAAAVAAYVAYRMWKNYQANGGGPGSPFQVGTNLNSIAPELVGGSTGPSVGPGVDLPINITLTETIAKPEGHPNSMVPIGTSPDNQLLAANPNGNGIGGSMMMEDSSETPPAMKTQSPTEVLPPDDDDDERRKHRTRKRRR